jgi:hypothetical protein
LLQSIQSILQEQLKKNNQVIWEKP